MAGIRRSPLLCALVACLSAGAPAAAVSDPLATGATLCLHPLNLPFSEAEAERRRPDLERTLTAALEGAGFRVADPAAVEALAKRVVEESGGFVDPVMGWRDEPRYLAFRDRIAAALHEELGCDGRLHVSVVTVRAQFNQGIAQWDGQTQQVSSTGRIVMTVLGGVSESGWVSAFSLWLRVTDLRGEHVAFRSAGIETPVKLAVVEDKDLVPEDRWLTDEARLREAIGSALGPAGAALRQAGLQP